MKDIKNAGFTMVEIIVTLVILAIVAAFTVPTLGGFIEDAHARDCKSKRTDLAKAYTTQLVDNGVASPGSTIDIMVMESVLEAKGATKDDGTAAAALGNEGEESNVVTYGEYLDLCPSGGVYSIKTKPSEDGTQSVLFLSCSQHGDVDVCEGADTLIVEGIQITKMPSKTIYNKGGAFTAAGGEIEVTFKDKNGKTTTKTINMTNAMCSQPNMQQTGSQSVTVSYGTKTASFTIEVKENIQLAGISITTPPTKTTYYWGESFNPAGMVVTATYSDGTSKAVTGYTITAPTSLNMQNVGDQDIAVSYTEGDVTKTATWSKITVKLVQIRIVKSDDNTVIQEFTDSQEGDGTALNNAISAVKEGQRIEVLVARYQLNPVWNKDENYSQNPWDNGVPIKKKVTITTAKEVVPGRACIYTTSTTASNLFRVEDSNAVLTLDNIALEGSGNAADPSTCRTVYVHEGKVVINNATISQFRLSKTNYYYGGVVAMKDKGSLTITGNTKISNCTVQKPEDIGGNTYGGAISAGGNATVRIGDASSEITIENCSANYGGAIAAQDKDGATGENANYAAFTLDGKVTIIGCSATLNGGAISMCKNSTLTLMDTSITGCSSPTGAVYAGGATTTIGGNAQIADNKTQANEGEALNTNLYLPSTKKLTIAEGGLSETAAVGVSMEDKASVASGQAFGQTTDTDAANVPNLNKITSDADTNLFGVAKKSGTNAIIWRSTDDKGICQLIHEEEKTPYFGEAAIQEAIDDAGEGDTIQMLVEKFDVTSKININDKSVTITKPDNSDTTLNNNITGADAMFSISGDGKIVSFIGLTLEGHDKNYRAINQLKGEVKLEDMKIKSFKRKDNGGAVNTDTGTLTITGTEGNGTRFENCIADDANGGAINLQNSTATISNTSFSGGSAKYGGALRISSSKVELDQTSFTDCKASNDAGAITLAGLSIMTMKNSTIAQCTAVTNGGGIKAADTSKVTVENSTITDCTASAQGGAVYANNTKGTTINDSKITNCKVTDTAKGSGGGIFVTSATLTIEGTTFNGCQSAAVGGGMTGYKSTVDIKTSKFENCKSTAAANTGTKGGAIRAADCIGTNGNVNITDTSFTGCEAYHGGVLSARESKVTIGGNNADKAKITDNTSANALLDCDGGTLNLAGALTITGNNNPKTQSIISHSGQEKSSVTANINITENVKIQNNSIDGSATSGIIGGGTTKQTITISDSVEISENTVQNGAGGVYVNTNSSLNLSGKVKITGNTSGNVESNVLLKEKKNLTVTANLENEAIIGVTAENRTTAGDQFGTRSNDTIIIPETAFKEDKDNLTGTVDGLKLVWKKSVVSIAFKTEKLSDNQEKTYYPTKTAYTEGEEFSADGGVIVVTYSDWSTEDVDLTESMCSNDYDMTKAGIYTIKVTYGNQTTNFQINVQKLIAPEDPEYVKCIQRLTEILYNQADSESTAYDFYHGSGWFANSGNRYSKVSLDSSNSNDGLVFLGLLRTHWTYYDSTSTIIDDALDKSKGYVNSQYTWAIIPNNTTEGYDITKSDGFNADENGYTIFWYLTGYGNIKDNTTYSVITYNTNKQTYRSGTITGRKQWTLLAGTYYWLDASTFHPSPLTQQKIAAEWVVNGGYLKGTEVMQDGIVYQALVDNPSSQPGTVGSQSQWVISGTRDGAPAPFDATKKSCSPGVLVTVKENATSTKFAVYRNDSNSTLDTEPPGSGWTKF